MKVLSLLAASSSAQFSDYNTNYGDYGLAGRRFAGSKDLTQYADWTGSPRSCSPNQGPILKQFRCYWMSNFRECKNVNILMSEKFRNLKILKSLSESKHVPKIFLRFLYFGQVISEIFVRPEVKRKCLIFLS